MYLCTFLNVSQSHLSDVMAEKKILVELERMIRQSL